MRLLNPQLRDQLVYGLLWGTAVWILETTAFALTRERVLSGWPFLLVLALFWITRGMVLALVAGWLAENLRPARAWLLFPVIAMVLSLLWDGSAWITNLSQRFTGVQLPPSGQFLFTLWPMLVYGALLFAFCLFDARSRRARALLAQAEKARLGSAMAIDGAQLELLSRRIDPGVLLGSLQAVRSAVAAGDARAGDRFDALVEFLRAAMPSLRGAAEAGAATDASQQQGRSA